MSLALVPDFDHDAERAVLAACVMDPATALATCDDVRLVDRHFADDRHFVLFRAVRALVRIGRSVDPITLGTFLRDHGVLERAGGANYFGPLWSEIPTAANLRYHAQLVVRRAKARGGRDDAKQRDEQAEQVGEAVQFLQLDADAFLRFPWPALDAKVGGMAPGTMGFVAGHPGGGKTSWLLTLICRLIAQGKRVMYAGLETRPNKLRTQIAARALGVDPGPIFAGNAQRAADWPERRAALVSEVERQRTDPRWVEHLRFCPQEHVDARAAVEIMAEAHDFGAHLVVIDHIDHVTADGKAGWGESRAIVQVFDTATKRHGLVTLAATQTNNEGDVRDPLLAHRPIGPKMIYMGKHKEQVAELFLSVFRPLRRTPEIGREELLEVREGTRPILELLAQATTCVHVFKSRALGDGKGALIDLGFWNGEVLDEVPKVLRHYNGTAGAA